MKLSLLLLAVSVLSSNPAHSQPRKVFQCHSHSGGKAVLVAYPQRDNFYTVDLKVTHPKLASALVGRFALRYHSNSHPQFRGKGQLGQTPQAIGINQFSDPFDVGFSLDIEGGIPGVSYVGYGHGGEFICRPTELR